MNISYWCFRIATIGPLGYLVAPGTVATLCTIPCVYILYAYKISSLYYVCLMMGFFFVAIYCINRALDYMRRYDDPPEIILDEVLGCLLTFWDVELSVQTMIIGFILFRFFDVSKIAGIHYVQHIVGAWGIMLDDVVAALLTNLILRLLFG